MKRLPIGAGFLATLLTAVTVPAEAGVIVREVYYQAGNNAIGYFAAAQTGSYIVTAAGGMGGGAHGGAGAIMTATFNWNAGDSFLMLVGAAGSALNGGSGTFLVKNKSGNFGLADLFLAAGGGGGSSRYSTSNIENTLGQDANFTTDGERGGSSVDGEQLALAGGNNGAAGMSPQGYGGAGGGGFSGNSYGPGGQARTFGASFGEVWQSDQDGRLGVPTKYNSGEGGVNFGGGGGGFSGGGAGNDRRQIRNASNYDYGGGGGGGSFVAPSGTLDGTAYNRSGNGYIRISFVDRIAPPPPPVPGVPEPATWAMMIIGFGLCGQAMRRRRSGPQLSYS